MKPHTKEDRTPPWVWLLREVAKCKSADGGMSAEYRDGDVFHREFTKVYVENDIWGEIDAWAKEGDRDE